MNEPEQNEADEPQAPERLRSELQALHAVPRAIPPRVDEVILRLAGEHLRQAGRGRRMLQFPRRWAMAAAAMLMLAAVLAWLWFPSRPRPEMVREDLNRDGRVDVLDAFALARRLHLGPVRDARFDMDGNGVVDQRDLDILTAHAVRLDGRVGG